MPSGGDSILISGGHMNPYGAASPQALFAATGGMAGASYMDAFGNIHQAAAPAVNDPYAAPALFGGAGGAPAAYMYSNAGGPLPGLGGDEIRTVFVSGFPHDVKERELHNLLRFMPGYEASQMNWKTGGPQGFALFASAVQARAVVELLSGLQFDDGVAIRAEMAHKNMFIKPEDPSVKRASRHSPTLISPTAILAPLAQFGGNGLAPSPLSPAAPTFMAAAAAAAAVNGSPTHHMGVPGMLASPVPVRPATFSPVTNLRDNPPCNTLFIGNLGDNTNEQELRTLFSSQPGYRQLKMVCGTKSTTAFVEFHDVPSAMMVHATLQGAVLGSSDRGGIRVQYSKNPFGRREICVSPHTGLSGSSVGGGDDGGMGGPASLVGSASPRSGAGGGGGMHGAASGLLVAGMQGPGAVGQLGQVGSAAGMVGAMIGPAGLDTVLGGNDA